MDEVDKLLIFPYPRVFHCLTRLPFVARPPPSSLLLAAQAQQADIAERNREMEEMKEKWRQEVQAKEKTLSDAALSVRTRDKKINNLNDQVSHAQDEQRRKQSPTIEKWNLNLARNARGESPMYHRQCGVTASES